MCNPSKRPGRIVVIAGPMFSEKTLRALSMLYKAIHGGKTVQAFRPDVPGRFPHEETHVVSRAGMKYPATTITSFENFFDAETDSPLLEDGVQFALFGEGQFFPKGLLKGVEPAKDILWVVRELRRRGVDTVIEGLDMTSSEEPFGLMPALMAIADDVIKTTAACTVCGDDAPITYRLTADKTQVLVGDKEYTALCYSCYYKRTGRWPEDHGAG